MSTRHPAIWRSLVGTFVLSFVPTAVGAVEHEVRILLDLDDDAGTGCLVNTVEGPFDGVEQVLISTVETTASPDAGTVTDAAISDCIDSGTDTFGVPASFDGGWPVGVGNGQGGRDVVETYFPLVASVVDEPRVVRLGVVVTDEQGGEQALLTVDDTPGGEAIVLDLRSVLEIPTLGEWGLLLLVLLLGTASVVLLGRRGTAAFVVVLVVLASGVAWAAGVLDGLTDDWSPADLLGSNGLVLFGKGAPDRLCFRVDVDLLFNQAPTISAIADQTVPEDGATGALAFTVGDFESPATSLTVTATSSNQVLVPDGNLVLGGSGANRTIEVTPAADQNGMTDVTVTVEDPDGGTASTTFRVTVTSDNDAPSISAIGDQTILEDGTTGPIPFTVGDVETPAGSLVVTATSDDQTILPDANLVLGGSGSNRTITATPAANQNGGPVTVTVTVQDTDGGSVPEQFALTVTPVNDPPSFGLAGDVVSNEDDPLQTVSNQVTGISPGPTADEAGQTVTLQVTNDDNALFSSQPAIDSAGTLTYQSAPDANGTATVTVVAQDDGGIADGGSDTSAPQTFQITVNPVNDPPAVTSPIAYTAVGNTLLRVDGATDGVSDGTGHDTALPGRVASTMDATDAFQKASPVDVDSPPANLRFQAGTFATTQSGSLTIDDDGDLVYDPPTGFTGLDDVVVNVEDQDGGVTPVTIEITVADVVWYVEDTVDGDKNPAAGGTGESTDPFETLAAAEAASGPGHVILVFETDGPLDEGITLKSGQKLYGQRVEEEPSSLLPGGLLLEEIDDTDARPQIHRTSGVAVTVDATGSSFPDPVEIRHLDLDSGDDDAIQVATGGTNTASVVIDETLFSGAGAHAVDVNGAHTSGTARLTITDNAFDATAGTTGNAFDVAQTGGGSLELAFDRNTEIRSNGGHGLAIDGSGGGPVFITSFAGNSVHPGTAGTGVFADTVTFDADPSDADFTGDQVAGGTLAVGVPGDGVGASGLALMNVSGDLAFTDLDLVADGGTGLLVTGTGELAAATGFRLSAPAGSTVAATGGPAVDVDPATIALAFDSLSSTASATRGVSLVDVAGAFSASSGSISGSAGDAFHVASSLANPLDVTYGGTITNSAGRLVFADGLPAGSDLLFDGTSLSDTGGTGIAVNDFQGVLTVTAAGTSILNSASTGFAATGNTDGTVNLDDVTITDPAGTAVHIVDSGDQIGGVFDFDNVDVSQGAGARLLDVQGLSGGSVGFDPASALFATAGTGVNVSSNAGSSSIALNGPVDLGTSGSRLSAGTAFAMIGNSAGTSVTAPDVDVFTSGQTAVSAAGAGTLGLNALSISTVNDGRALDLDGIVSLVAVDSVTCSHNSHCVDLTNLGAGSTTTFAAADLTCTGGTCFNATSARTVEVTGAGNTIGATTAGGINLTNTTIGAGGVTWESVSASGTANGIVLNTTGTTGAFTVTGDGSTTGGVLDRDGSGGAITSTIGVQLTNAHDVTLRQMDLTNNGDHAVQGTGGSDHVLSAVTIQNPTNHGWEAIDLQGASRIDHGSLVTQFNGTNQDGVRLVNTDTGFTSFTVDDVTFSNSSTGNDGFFHRALGTTAGSIVVTNSTFTGLDADGAQVANDGSGTIVTTVQGNSFTTADATGGDGNNGLALNLGGTGVHQFTVGGTGAEGNTFSDLTRLGDNSGVINVTAAGAGTGATSRILGTIQGNTVSDSDGRRGISVLLEASGGTGHGGHTIVIDNNAVNDVAREGIYVGMSSVAGRSNTGNRVTVTNNSVGDVSVVSTAGNREGIEIEAFHDGSGGGSIEADVLVQNNVAVTNNSDETFRVTNDAFVLSGNPAASTTLDVTVLGNLFTNNDASGDSFEHRNFDAGSTSCLDVNAANQASGRNDANRGYLIVRSAGTFGIEGLAAGTHTDAAVNTFVDARNDGGASAASGGSFTGGVACTLP